MYVGDWATFHAMSSHLLRSKCGAARPSAAVACVAAVIVALAAGCTSSDDGGGDIDVGSGQAPDAATVDFPIAYVKRPVPENPPDARRMLPFLEGGDLYVRDRASPSAPERNVTFEFTQGLGDVRDVEPSWDGRKLVFAMRAPLIEGAEPEDQPTWNIWEYEVATRTLARVIVSDTVAEDGHDFAPHYLPDGRIVFASTRQRQSKAVLLDEGKPQFAALDENRAEPAFVLHAMNADGSDVRQLSFNQSHDLDPAVLPDGRIVFSRWDNAGSTDAMHLYTVNPDGSGMELLYGADSHATGTDGATVQFLDPRPMPDGRVLALVRPYAGTELGGDLLAIDVANYVNDTQPTRPNLGVLAGPAQVPVTANVVTTIPGPSPGGRFSAAYPLDDGTGRILVSWTQCRLLEQGRIVPCTAERLAAAAPQPAPPLYGVWMYDPRQSTQLPVVAPEEGTMITDVVALQPRALPAVLVDDPPAPGLETRLAEADTGLLDIRSVYDVAGVDTSVAGIAVLADPARTTAPQRPARFLRIEKPVGLPEDEVLELPGFAFGVSAAQGMREIIGYAPVEPDGSVRVQVPAGVPLAITVLDADGRRISPRHQNWLQVKAGEIVSCNGCHVPTDARSHGRRELFAAANSGATTTGLPFPNTVDAIFADFGETMAQARGRISCQDDCASIRPTVDVVFEDVWTDPAKAGRPADAAFAYRYADLGTLAPVSADCQATWNASCRVVIHYEAHLHPLWSLPRQTFDAMGMLVADHTCTSCHTTVDAAGAPQVPAGQLDLTDGLSDQVAQQFKSYRELLAGDAEQELVGGALQDRLVQTGVDDQGRPVFSTVPVRPSMSVAGARASVTFFSKFAAGGSHAGWLSPAELRLVSEWLDLGAQYFNDPFAVPVD
jgi:Tol biopolymer transport system component